MAKDTGEPQYVALKEIDLGDGKVAHVGESVPGAANWPGLQRWIDAGHVRYAGPGEKLKAPKEADVPLIDHGASPIQTPDGPLLAPASAPEGVVEHVELSAGVVADDPSPMQTPERSKEAAAAIKSGEATAGTEPGSDVAADARKSTRKSTRKSAAKKSAAKKSTAKSTRKSTAKSTATETPTSAPGKSPKGTSGEIVNNVDSPIQTPERSRKSAAKKSAARKTTARKR